MLAPTTSASPRPVPGAPRPSGDRDLARRRWPRSPTGWALRQMNPRMRAATVWRGMRLPARRRRGRQAPGEVCRRPIRDYVRAMDPKALKRILVPTDFSDRRGEAIETASRSRASPARRSIWCTSPRRRRTRSRRRWTWLRMPIDTAPSLSVASTGLAREEDRVRAPASLCESTMLVGRADTEIVTHARQDAAPTSSSWGRTGAAASATRSSAASPRRSSSTRPARCSSSPSDEAAHELEEARGRLEDEREAAHRDLFAAAEGTRASRSSGAPFSVVPLVEPQSETVIIPSFSSKAQPRNRTGSRMLTSFSAVRPTTTGPAGAMRPSERNDVVTSRGGRPSLSQTRSAAPASERAIDGPEQVRQVDRLRGRRPLRRPPRR